ncbi:hypothetical protein P162_0014 [Bacteriophage T5-like cott162]|uniref:Uncharacterized protein n=8 Tax=Epseptimavirus TaxID=2732017 RepID=A0A6G8RD09_9CAUD|nr:hypothetical protein HOS37_gp013 [Escherichia phage saus132]YP_009816672.1 hypothetical protein HOU65_gp023 [Salmonella phage Seafire]ASU02378.1 hypothetical protein P1301_0015 [Bacteriophage T5-like chee130_1]ASU02684.1 hypothetical protein P149_0013 [Bacteriophage T5-like poul149]ASU02839.1 hypothetical protein P158_0015 [Bacteriophage T5-like chee158]ASU02993.1 hypothetical protein P162_0014 [Bacteriophage T5-like cott162]ASU03147.1 hypothetical protein P176N_0015 [Bacteriophage T5-like
MFTQQTIKVVADHELDTWDYSFKDLTATVQFKSMQLSFLHIDLQACKEFQAKLMNARKIFGTARIPADNLINSLIDAGYKLVKTEVNRPSTPVTIRDPWQSGPIAMLNNSDKRLMSDMHNVPCGGVISNTQSYKFGEASSVDEWNKAGVTMMSFAKDRGAQEDSVVSRNSYTIHLSNPSKDGELEEMLTKVFEAIDADKARGR